MTDVMNAALARVSTDLDVLAEELERGLGACRMQRRAAARADRGAPDGWTPDYRSLPYFGSRLPIDQAPGGLTTGGTPAPPVGGGG